MKRQSFLRRFITSILATAMASIALTGVTSSPAFASRGGEVINYSGTMIAITNCWSAANGWNYLGWKPRCSYWHSGLGTEVYFLAQYNENAIRSWRWLPDYASNWEDLDQTYWADVDAFRVEAGCTLTTDGGYTYVAPPSSEKWFKISNTATIFVLDVQC